MDLTKEFKGFIERNQLNLYHQTVVLGVSGGIDSMVMLNLMEKMQDEYGFKIVVAHVNHKKRKESEIEEEYIKKYCENKHDFCVLHFEEEDKSQNFKALASSLYNAGKRNFHICHIFQG